MDSSESFLVNRTLYEDDPFEDVSKEQLENLFSNSSPNYSNGVAMSTIEHLFIAAKILEIFICVCAVAASIFLLVMFAKFKYLRTRPNFYILFYIVNNLLHTVVTPVIIFLIHLAPYGSLTLICVCMQINTALLGLNFFIAFLLALDWFLVAYKPNILRQYAKIYKYIFIIIYIICMLKIIIVGITCSIPVFRGISHVVMTAFICTFYSVMLALVLLLYCLKRKKVIPEGSKKYEYCLTMSLWMLLVWLPLLIIHILIMCLELSPTPNSTYLFMVFLVGYIPLYIVNAFPICMVYLLGQWNKNFKMAYDTCFKRSVQSYQNENIDDVSDEEGDTDRNKVSYVPAEETATVITF